MNEEKFEKETEAEEVTQTEEVLEQEALDESIDSKAESGGEEKAAAEEKSAEKEPEKKLSKKEYLIKELIEWVKVAAITLVAALVITSFVRPTLVIGDSMTNTFQPYDYLLVYKRAYKNKLPEYGDVVLFQSHLALDNGRGEKILIKRVIGLPGDSIDIYDGKVYRNGEELVEPYLRDGATDGDLYIPEIPEGEIFAMGDNRFGSNDSRNPAVGTIPQDALLGKVIIRLFPFNAITTDFSGE